MVRLYPFLTVATLILFLLFASSGAAVATPPISPDDVLWSQEISGPGDEHAFSVIATADGGYAVAGIATVSGTEYGLLVKTGAQGNKNWSRTYAAGRLAEFYDLRQATDGGYILAGSALPKDAKNDLCYDGLAVLTDATGAQVWLKTFGSDSLDTFTAAMADGSGYSFAGLNTTGDSSCMKSCLVRTDLNGGAVFESVYGDDTRNVQCYDARHTPDGGYVLVGASGQPGVYGKDQLFVARISGQGKVVWQKTFAAGTENYAESVAIVDGGYAIAGAIDNGAANGSYDFYLAKLDSDGNLLWSRSYGGLKEDRAKCVIATPDGGYLLAGIQGPEDGNTSAYVVKTDSAGEPEWNRSFEDSSRDIRLYRAVMAPDGGYVIAGYVSTPDNGDDVWLVKLRGEPATTTTATATSTVTATAISAATTTVSPAATPVGRCCLPMLILPLLLIGTAFAAARRR